MVKGRDFGGRRGGNLPGTMGAKHVNLALPAFVITLRLNIYI